MKKPFFFIFCLFIIDHSFAQNGFFLRGQAGIGETKMNNISTQAGGRMPLCDCGYELDSRERVSSVEANADLGYQYGPVRFITGLQLIRTGNMQDAWSIAFPSGKTYKRPITDANANYYHLLIPISMSFRIPLVHNLSLYPELGTKLLYITENGRSLRHEDAKTFLFNAKINVERALNKQVSLVVTPAFYSIISPVYYTPQSEYSRLYSFNRAFMLQAGVLWHVPHKTRDEKVAVPDAVK